MSVLEKVGSYTFEDFCRLVKDGEKADLIDGVIYMASPDNLDANSLFVWLVGLIHLYAEEYDLGEVYGSRVAFRLSEKSGPEPDIAFVKKVRGHLAQRGYFDGEPDLAIEIVSPSSVERDYKKKRKLYQQFATKEYWIIDEVEEKVVMLRLGPNGKYREVRPKNGQYHSKVLKGFWFRPEWFWQRPFLRTLTTLNEILAAGPPLKKRRE